MNMAEAQMKNIILYIDSGTFREDYARVYRAIYAELIALGFNVQTILGPRSTDETIEKFQEMNPAPLESILHHNKVKFSSDIFAFLKAIALKHIPTSRRKPWQLISSYFHFNTLVNYIKKCQPSLVISIKYDSCYEFIAAANSLNIKTIAIQHGEPYLGQPSAKKVHEWPASIILVWSDFWREYYTKTFPDQASYYSINSILWHSRYLKKTKKKSNKIVIYESNMWPAMLIEKIISSFPPGLVELKPHPYKVEKNYSDVIEKYPELINSDELWFITPRLGLSLGSTVTNELIFHDSPCLTICPSSEVIGGSFPVNGSFLADADPDKIITLMNKIYFDPEFHDNFLVDQINERQRYYNHKNSARQVAEFCLSQLES